MVGEGKGEELERRRDEVPEYRSTEGKTWNAIGDQKSDQKKNPVQRTGLVILPSVLRLFGTLVLPLTDRIR